ncbi:hypothetical protein NMD51_24735 (plasmid) [Escherichia coli]|uniref:hypothetical protein n=1 Tax=Escherichia coli TaxID=562 RepID=UPI00351D786C
MFSAIHALMRGAFLLPEPCEDDGVLQEVALYIGGVSTESLGYVGGGFQDLRSAWDHDHASHA